MRDGQRLRVVFLVLDAYGLGGTVRTVLNTANHLAARGTVDVQVLSVFRTADEPPFPIHPRVRVTVLHDARHRASATGRRRPRGRRTDARAGVRRVLSDWLTRTRLRPFHRDEEAFSSLNLLVDLKVVRAVRQVRDAVLVSTRPGLNLLCAAVAHRSVGLVGQEHLHHDAHARSLQRAIRRRYPRLDLLVVLTEADERRYREVLGPDVPITRIPNALPDLEAVEADLASPVVAAAGRLVPQKGFDLLVEAFRSVADAHPEWRLRIYGRGPEHAALQQQVAELGLEEHVVLMGPTARLEHEMAGASVFVLSSRFEGFGMVLVEAMHVGLPVVSFDCPHGPAEIIRDGRDGILVPAGDVGALGEALNQLIEDPEERRRLGRAGRAAAARFDVAAIGDDWYRALEDVASRGAPGW